MQVPEGLGPTAALAILQELNRTACGGRCAVGSGGKAVGCAVAVGVGDAACLAFPPLHPPAPVKPHSMAHDVACCMAACVKTVALQMVSRQ